MFIMVLKHNELKNIEKNKKFYFNMLNLKKNRLVKIW